MATNNTINVLNFYFALSIQFLTNIFWNVERSVRGTLGTLVGLPITLGKLIKFLYTTHRTVDEFNIWDWCKENNNFLMRVSLSSYQLFYTKSIHITIRILRLALDLGLDLS
jgi:hypothetical protein